MCLEWVNNSDLLYIHVLWNSHRVYVMSKQSWVLSSMLLFIFWIKFTNKTLLNVMVFIYHWLRNIAVIFIDVDIYIYIYIFLCWCWVLSVVTMVQGCHSLDWCFSSLSIHLVFTLTMLWIKSTVLWMLFSESWCEI